MTEDEIHRELRTIKVLLALDKKDELQQLADDMEDVHSELLSKLSADEWRSGFIEEVADEADLSARSVRRRLSDLVNRKFVERRGQGGGTEYRKTGLSDAVDLATEG